MNCKQKQARVDVLAIGFSLLFVVIGVQTPAFSQERTKAERYVLAKAQAGEAADLKTEFPDERDRKLSGDFIKELLTNPNNRLEISSHGITIWEAVITDEIDLINDTVPNDITLSSCIFEGEFNATQSHFLRTLDLTGSTFKNKVDFENAAIEFDFKTENCHYDRWNPSDDLAFFKSVRVGRDWLMSGAKFDVRADFTESDIGGKLSAAKVTFESDAEFDGIRVKGESILREATFRYGQAQFGDTHFANLFLTDADFEKASVVDFTGMQVDSVFFDRLKFNNQRTVKIEGMTFKSMSPATWEALQYVAHHSEYNPEFYTNLETLFRSHGYTGEADDVYIAKQQEERHIKCKSFFHDCEKVYWAKSVFEDWLVGYGRRLEKLLLWSILFVAVGSVVFRRNGMKKKKPRKE